MQMNKNYFSDITDLFLKAKKEENIQIDEGVKASIRQMLQNEIHKMKTSGDPELSDSKKSFWSVWKNQLVGVPVSLAAIALVVYAATNLNVSIPKEDFSPTQNIQPKTVEIQEEKTQPTEFDRPLVKTAEGTLITDSLDTEEKRSLNKITTLPQTTEKLPRKSNVTFETPKIEYPDNATFILKQNQEPEIEPIAGNNPQPETQIIEETDETATVATKEVNSETCPDEDSLDADIPPKEAETIVEIPNLNEKAIIKPDSENIPIYTYKDPDLKTQPAFSKKKLSKLTRSKTPESITVYYVTDKQVVVEIEENGVTKWYLFDKLDENWTISKYEKYNTASVVK